MPNDTLDNVIGYDNPVTYFISINTRDSMSQKNTLKGVLCVFQSSQDTTIYLYINKLTA